MKTFLMEFFQILGNREGNVSRRYLPSTKPESIETDIKEL